ncbi:MAG TPA: hypothetical protein VJ160_02305 [Anaerolineales bacterium]|nr:hypothetical protein [Anaerolineales bacterium]
MAKPLRTFALFAAPLLVLSLACSLVSGPDIDGSEVDPVIESGLGQGVLFQDDFSDTSSGWDQVEAEEGVTNYAHGAYRIFVGQADRDYWANPGLSFGDVRVEVDATKVGGPDDNDFGVICRYQDVDNFYGFLVSSDGYYSITKVADGVRETLGTDGWPATDAVHQGDASNRIRADCIGDELSIYANGQLVYSTNDSAFATGDVGLIAGTFSETGTDILFDNFVVLRP